MTTLCCKLIPAAQPVLSPFDKMIVSGYYDGPTSGVFFCGVCMSAYSFYMLDWGVDHNVRVFALKPLVQRTLPAIIRFVGEEPQWPMWFPSALRQPSDSVRDDFHQLLEKYTAQDSIVQFANAWSTSGAVSINARRLTAPIVPKAVDWFTLDDLSELFDWFGFLGLQRK